MRDKQNSKKLHKSKNKMIGGIAAGFAEYLEIDSTVMRLIFVVLIFATGGVMILFYLLALIIMPEG